MKKKVITLISIVLIILTIIAVIFVIKNKGNNTIKITGNIDPETFYALTKFEIDNEEKVQIVDVSHMDDASSVTYYNFDFNKKSVIYLHRSTGYGPGNEGEYYDKREYQLTEEDFVYVKEKLEELNEIGTTEIPFMLGTTYDIETKDGRKTFLSNSEAGKIIKDIIKVTYSDEVRKLLEELENNYIKNTNI